MVKIQDLIWGQVEHETEIYVRTLFGEPVNNVVYENIWRILMQDPEKTDKILERFPSQCSEKPGLFEGLVNNLLENAEPGDLVHQERGYDCFERLREGCHICKTFYWGL